jgi:guanyl-specific ribonuclease Sa
VRGSAWQPTRQHAYVYAANNPLRYRDPSGREAEPAGGNTPSGEGHTVQHDGPYTGDWIEGGPDESEPCIEPTASGCAGTAQQENCDASPLHSYCDCGGPSPGSLGSPRGPNLPNVPAHVRSIVNTIRGNGNRPLQGYHSGTFQSREGRLPSGQYVEHDVYPYVPGVDRGAERIVYDPATNQFYYTSDHYGSFTPVP